jgi:hypothetical protein
MTDEAAFPDESANAEARPDKPPGLPVPVEGPRLEEPASEATSQAPPRLNWSFTRDDAPQAPRRDWRRIAAAASLASVVAIGGAAAAVHWRQAERAEIAETRTLVHRLDALSARFESLETNRIRDELASQRKLIAEIKAGAANARDVSGAVGQLGARVDRLEKDQSARLDRLDHDASARLADVTTRLDKLESKATAAVAASKDQSAKLAERMDHDAAARLADMTARLDKLESKVATATAAIAAPPPKPPAKPEAAKVEPTVSNETTGSIEKPRPRLRGFFVSEIHNGYAMIDGPAGEFAVGPGDIVPGAGRVIRIERHGRDWVVITTTGQITAMED